jgi:hypothetical protein
MHIILHLMAHFWHTASRLLAFDRALPAQQGHSISMGPTQVYQAKVVGESFSVPILVTFPEPPKSQYVLRFRVVLMDDHDAFDLALHCVTFSSLYGDASVR